MRTYEVTFKLGSDAASSTTRVAARNAVEAVDQLRATYRRTVVWLVAVRLAPAAR